MPNENKTQRNRGHRDQSNSVKRPADGSIHKEKGSKRSKAKSGKDNTVTEPIPKKIVDALVEISTQVGDCVLAQEETIETLNEHSHKIVNCKTKSNL